MDFLLKRVRRLAGADFCCWLAVLVSLAAVLPNAAIFGQETGTFIEIGTPVKRTIKGGETQTFRLRLKANETAEIVVVQFGIDVSLAASDAVGTRFLESESPSGLLGNDGILVTASKDGEYLVTVSPANPRSPAGDFTLEFKQVRATTKDDLLINEAAGKITAVAVAAGTARAKGTYDGRVEAIAKWDQVITLAEQKRDPVWKGIAQLSKGIVYEQLGEIQNALEVYLEALKIWRQLGNRQYEASAINNIGIIYNDIGEYEKAVINYNQAIAIQREIGNRQSEGIYLNNLAYAFMRLQKYDEAELIFRQALVIKREDDSARGQRSVAVTINNLGMTLVLGGKREAGIKHLEEALALRKNIDDRWGVANSLLNLGRMKADGGRSEESAKLLTEANTRSKELGDRRMEAESLYLLANAEFETGQIDDAIMKVERGLQLVEAIRAEFFSNETRYAYFSTVQDYYDLYIDLLVARFERDRDNADKLLALEVSERSRARGLLELLSEARVDLKTQTGIGVKQRIRKQRVELNERYAARQRLLSETYEPTQLRAVDSDISRLEAAIADSEIELEKENPRFAKITKGAAIKAHEVQLLLDEETTLLEYKLTKRRSFLWVVSKRSIELFVLPGRSLIDQNARTFYELVKNGKDRDSAEFRKAERTMFDLILAPAATSMKTKRLLIVADGALHYVPFSSLPATSAANTLLVDQAEIVMLPSGSVLGQIREQKKVRANPKETNVAIFADPVFDRGDSRIKIQSVKGQENGSVQRFSPDGDASLPRLLASAREARNIASFSVPASTRLRTGFEAKLDILNSDDLSRYSILHFATHGIISTERPADSGLVLTQFDERGLPLNGFLNLDGIFNLSLNSELVVLSACRTAIGKEIRGEGIVGISQGFLYAGSQRVVASLWKVDDFATAEFMKLFYKHLIQEKKTPAAALRFAKIEMKKIPRYRSPLYWSAFVLLGEFN
jgi:CHAT domain-containing protein/Flp pilus assembly protein TadD